MQAAFALEDPNSRFAQVFAHKDAMGPRVATLADVPSRTYDTVVDHTEVLFQAKPANSPALSRVLVQGGARMSLIRFLENAMENAEYFVLHSIGSAEPLRDLSAHPTDIGNFMYRLAINSDLNTAHDVAVMFAWGLSSDKGTMMELSAWPIDKEAA
jgi:hypothetical protein